MEEYTFLSFMTNKR